METAKTPNQLQIQDFLLSITSQNSILTLEAKSQSSVKIFTVSIDNDVITQITNGLFDSAESLAQGLKDAASGSFPELRIVIDPQGKLTYTMIFSAGTRKREDSFSIDLTEKETKGDSKNPNKTTERWKEEYERKMNRLEETFQVSQAKNEERLNQLENMILQMGEKINQRFDLLEKLYEVGSGEALKSRNSHKEEVKKPIACFNALSFNKSHYEYDSEKTTVRLLHFGGSYPCLEIVPQIPQSGQHSYSFRINQEKSSLVFGISTETKKYNWNGDNCNYYYWTEDGSIYGKTRQIPDAEGPFGGSGKTVKMVVDMGKGALTFFVDDKQVNSYDIPTCECYFAYISLGRTGDSVTLIEL